jgi:hypothetical protein
LFQQQSPRLRFIHQRQLILHQRRMSCQATNYSIYLLESYNMNYCIFFFCMIPKLYPSQ